MYLSRTVPSFLAVLTASLFSETLAEKCVPLYGQCGGYGYSGPTCCEQPQTTVLNPYIPYNSVKCQKTSPDGEYAQCNYMCSYEEPCFSQGYCAPSAGDNGAGKRYCGYQSSCTNPDWCFDVANNQVCICRGDVPCRLNTRPGGCTGLRMVNGKQECPGVTERCPAFEGEQCGGGAEYNGPTECQDGLTCTKYSETFSGCPKV